MSHIKDTLPKYLRFTPYRDAHGEAIEYFKTCKTKYNEVEMQAFVDAIKFSAYLMAKYKYLKVPTQHVADMLVDSVNTEPFAQELLHFAYIPNVEHPLHLTSHYEEAEAFAKTLIREHRVTEGQVITVMHHKTQEIR